MKFKNAFTLIELIFTIVIIGVLSSIMIPKMVSMRDDAIVSKNIEYIMSSMMEIATYIVAKEGVEENLTEMSTILNMLDSKGRVILDTDEKSAQIKIGEDIACITIDIDTNDTIELLQTKFSDNTNDRICNLVQLSIKEKDYPLVLRGRLIKF